MPSFVDKLKGLFARPAGPASGAKGAVSAGPSAMEQVDEMAALMNDQQRVTWATKSARRVLDKLTPEDVKALEAAEAWLANPDEGLADAAAKAAGEAAHAGPGAWAAQAAGWSAKAETLASAGAAADALTASAAAGAVKLAAAAAGLPAGITLVDAASSDDKAPADEPDAAPPADSESPPADEPAPADAPTEPSDAKTDAPAPEPAPEPDAPMELTDEQRAEQADALEPFLQLGRDIMGPDAAQT